MLAEGAVESTAEMPLEASVDPAGSYGAGEVVANGVFGVPEEANELGGEAPSGVSNGVVACSDVPAALDDVNATETQT